LPFNAVLLFRVNRLVDPHEVFVVHSLCLVYHRAHQRVQVDVFRSLH
jgi:hypothetical protein